MIPAVLDAPGAMRKSRKRLRLCATLILCDLIFIWGNSLLPGEVSGALSQWVKDLLSSFLPGDGPGTQGSGLLRKIAHFTEFACLGALLAWLFAMLRGRPGVMPVVLAFAAACIDESIQCFVPDRGPSLWDVGLDTCGAAVSILLLTTGIHIRKNIHNKKWEETK